MDCILIFYQILLTRFCKEMYGDQAEEFVCVLVHEPYSDFISNTEYLQPFLSQTREIFVLNGISENVQAASKNFRRFSEDFHAENAPTNFEHLWSHLKGDKFSDKSQHNKAPLWNVFVEIARNWISFIDPVL